MKSYRTHVAVAVMSVFFLPSLVVAGDLAGVMMKDGEATGPMDHEMTTTNGHKVMPDGTMKMPDGKKMRMTEGQMMTTNGKMMEAGTAIDGGKGMPGGKGTQGGKGMNMEGMHD